MQKIFSDYHCLSKCFRGHFSFFDVEISFKLDSKIDFELYDPGFHI